MNLDHIGSEVESLMSGDQRHFRLTVENNVMTEHQDLLGREHEILFFLKQMSDVTGIRRILNIYGTGGVGKTTLLHEFRRISELAEIPFLLLDCRMFSRTPTDFCLVLLNLLHYPAPSLEYTLDLESLTELCRKAILETYITGKIVIALDTFEEIGVVEHWLRDCFLDLMPPEVLFVISGRSPLQPSWYTVPAWKQVIYRLPLTDLDFAVTKAYLQRSNIFNEDTIQFIWSRTRGHPLSLALLASTTISQSHVENIPHAADDNELFVHIAQTWLREVPDSEMRELVESAAVARNFNQELLCILLGRSVKTEQFQQLVSYSFIQRIDRGWLLHELLREAIANDLRLRMPERYNQLWKRCVLYYSNKLKQSARKKSASWVNSEFSYYIGNQFIQFLLQRHWISYSVEPLSPTNWMEAEQYIERRRITARDVDIVFMNQDTHTQESYTLSVQESLQVLNQIRLKELYELDTSCVKLIRNADGAINGIMEIIPINERTMNYLLSVPLSSSYFNALSETVKQELMVTENHNSGFFVKTLDVFDFSDSVMMHASLSTLINHILTTGYIVAAPVSNPISRAICMSLGLEVVEGIYHRDYDGLTPTPYYFLDTRGNKVIDYVNKMINSFGMQEEYEVKEQTMTVLTQREKEVVQRLIMGRSNLEVAMDLVISEVTVKKHLSNIFRKLDVKSRSQLIHKVTTRSSMT